MRPKRDNAAAEVERLTKLRDEAETGSSEHRELNHLLSRREGGSTRLSGERRLRTARGVLSGAIFGLLSRWSLTDSWMVAAGMDALFGAFMAVFWLVFAFFGRQREAAKRL